MYKILYALIIIIWVIDITNINFIIERVNIREYLDVTLPINGWAWFLILTFLPGTSVTMRKES